MDMCENFIRRYVSLADGIDYLMSSKIALGEYAHWEDRNESASLKAYEKALGLSENSLRITCFTQAAEAYHHWSIFAKYGLCFCLKKEAIVQRAREAGFKCEPVEYIRVDEVTTNATPEKWPFLKRAPFADEKEFRILSETESGSIELDPGVIDRIYISPWMRESARDNIKKLLQQIDYVRDSKLPIYKTTLLENSKWVKFFQSRNA